MLATESPHGMITFGLRREVLEGEVEEPEDVLAGIDAVTVEDVQRVAEDVIGQNGLKLALIGPFDDAERFEGPRGLSTKLPRASSSSYGGAFVLAAPYRPARRQSR